MSAIDKNVVVQQTPHHIETINKFPMALITTNDGFIGSYLSQKLLELPLDVFFLSKHELEEIKHLKTNQRFKPKIMENENNLNEKAFPQLDYVFQIADLSSNNEDKGKIEEFTKKLLQITKAYSAKFQLTLITNSQKDLRKAIGTHMGHTEKKDERSIFDSPNPLEQKVLGFSKEYNLDARIVYLVNAYGPKMPINKDWELARLLRSLHRDGRLLIEGEGLSPLYPIFITDAASALAKAMFTEGLKDQTLFLAGEKEITAINLAYKLREMLLHETGQMLEIHFTSTGQDAEPLSERMLIKSNLVKSQEDLEWKQTVDLQEGLTKTLKWLEHQPKLRPVVRPKAPKTLNEVQKISKKIEVSKTKRARKVVLRKRAILTSILFLIIAVLIPPIIFTATAGSAAFALQKATAQLKQTNVDRTINMSKSSSTLFRAARYQLTLVSKAIPQNHNSALQVADGYLETGQLLAQALQHTANSLKSSSEIKDIMLADSRGDFGRSLTKLNGELDSLYSKLSFIQALLDKKQDLLFSLLPQKLEKELIEVGKNITQTREKVTEARKILDLAPNIFALKGKRTFLVIFQNNAELRPTGGFIGSYALITFEKGKLLDFSVEDVYTADGQLKGHVEPPTEIRKYLGEAGWYLRDSNWDPDFPTAARQIEWFFEKETGKRVDGTIALNLYVIQEILRALGPIKLADYEETINAENLFEIAEYYSEINFFPGSTQKKDFLVSLSKGMVFESEKAGPNKLAKLVTALSSSLQKGQLLIALHDPQAQQTFNDLGWDGSLKEVECKADRASCAKTYVALREANLGVNKANYFIKRKIAVSQTVNQDAIQTKLTVNYQNQSPANKWPGGDYKNYMRIYLNEESKLVRVNVNGEDLVSSQLSLTAEHGKQVVGFLLTVPVKQESQVILVTLAKGMVFEDGKAQTKLLLQKQPGTENDPLLIKVIYPQDYKLKSANRPLQMEQGSATLSQNFTQDLDLQVEFEEVE